jgi:hypothetical protein
MRMSRSIGWKNCDDIVVEEWLAEFDSLQVYIPLERLPERIWRS